MSKKVQRHTAWVCVGKNKGVEEPTWFYAFRTSEKGVAFMKEAEAHTNPDISTVKWEMYPCEFMSVDDTISDMEESVRVEETVEGG